MYLNVSVSINQSNRMKVEVEIFATHSRLSSLPVPIPVPSVTDHNTSQLYAHSLLKLFTSYITLSRRSLMNIPYFPSFALPPPSSWVWESTCKSMQLWQFTKSNKPSTSGSSSGGGVTMTMTIVTEKTTKKRSFESVSDGDRDTESRGVGGDKCARLLLTY